jgi:hypothetical protein
MLIVAVAWIYVVGLMALTEPTVVAGIMTFLFYCVVPLATGLLRRDGKAQGKAPRGRTGGRSQDGSGDDSRRRD